MYCTNCGREASDSSAFCSNCGNSLSKKDAALEKAMSLFANGDPQCISLLEECANNGNSFAYYALGEMYDFGEIVSEDVEKAIYYYNNAIKMGNQVAMCSLGSLYFSGRDGESNRCKAFNLFLAYIQNNPDDSLVNFELARCYRDGIGTTIDIGKTEYYFRKAIELEPNKASYLFQYAVLLENQNDTNCIEYYEKALNLRSDYAACSSAYSLGEIYREGKILKQNYEKAEKYYLTAIELADKNDNDDVEVAILAQNAINLMKAKQEADKNINAINQEHEILAKAFEALEQGALAIALNYYRSIPNSIESKFFSAYITSVEQGYEMSDMSIDNMSRILNGIVPAIKNLPYPMSHKINLYINIAIYATKFMLHIYRLDNNKLKELISFQYNSSRIAPLAFANKTMTPRCDRLANMLYKYGDDIETAFPNGEVREASKIAWEYGCMPMEYSSKHGTIFEKSNRKSKMKLYKRKSK